MDILKFFFKKKFKVRVVHFIEDFYAVEYAHYYFFPKFYQLSQWYSPTLLGRNSNEGWSTYLADYQNAEERAITLNSIEDVIKWDEELNKKKKKYEEESAAYLARNAAKLPYKIKNIK